MLQINSTSSPYMHLMRHEAVQSVVHDLRSPMTVIKGNLQLLLSGVVGQMTSEQLLLLRRSIDPLEDLILMTDNLLQSTSLEKEDLTIHPEETDLDKLLSGVIAFYVPTFKQRGIQLFRDGNSFDKKLNIDSGWVKRALNNLIWNAYKFTGDNGKVSLHVEPCFDGIEIVVQDTGCGIPASKMDEIFDKFFQVSPSRDSKIGTGLGLWICKRVLQLHDGMIRVESEEGKGSRFILHFPSTCVL